MIIDLHVAHRRFAVFQGQCGRRLNIGSFDCILLLVHVDLRRYDQCCSMGLCESNDTVRACVKADLSFKGPEILPLEARTRGTAVSVSAHWIWSK